jgi:nickel/cobalt transporter (NiCoT) family protein
LIRGNFRELFGGGWDTVHKDAPLFEFESSDPGAEATGSMPGQVPKHNAGTILESTNIESCVRQRTEARLHKFYDQKAPHMPDVLPELEWIRRGRPSFSAPEWLRIAGLYGFVALLHGLGWGLYLHYSRSFPALLGLGFAAYMFGLRHAFDADHIAAVDDALRFMLQKGRQSLGVGFFFSLGHSTVVLVLSVTIAFAATAVRQVLPQLRGIGGIIGAGVSGTFLWIIGILNLLILLDILKVWQNAKIGKHNHAHMKQLLQQRGLFSRLLGGSFQKLMNHSWQMYPLGLLFGLGFDTASEVGLLAMTAGASVGNLPVAAILSLPILFSAGMTVMDTTDGILMSKAYSWAFVNPLRKLFYNITTTGLSVAVALLIGSIELLQVFIGLLDLRGRVANFIASLDFGALGYLIVAMFLLSWGLSAAVWKFGRIEERYELDQQIRGNGSSSNSSSERCPPKEVSRMT